MLPFTAIAEPKQQADNTQNASLLRPQQDEDGILSLTLENDYFAGVDNGYTNGFRLAYLSPERNIPGWIESAAHRLPFFASEGHKRYSIAVGQSIFTPDNLEARSVIADERPYAGFLFGSVGMLTDTGYRLDNLQLTLGIVGPAALGEETQDAVHHLIDSPLGNGWDNQLDNEPAIILSYERKWRGIYEFSASGLGVDITPHLGASIGNIHTYASTGATVRFGYDLPADYGPPLIRPSLPGSDFFTPQRNIGWYFFAGLEGRAVARNIFLDGNSFSDSHSVDKKNFVGSLQAGAAFVYEDIRIAYTHIFRTREYDQQDHSEEFGAITVSYRF